MENMTIQEIEEKMDIGFLEWVAKRFVGEMGEHEKELYRMCFYAGCDCGTSFFKDLVL